MLILLLDYTIHVGSLPSWTNLEDLHREASISMKEQQLYSSFLWVLQAPSECQRKFILATCIRDREIYPQGQLALYQDCLIPNPNLKFWNSLAKHFCCYQKEIDTA